MNITVLPYSLINILLFAPLFFYAIVKIRSLPGIVIFTLFTAYTISITQSIMPIYQEQSTLLWIEYFISVAFSCLLIFLAHFLTVKILDFIKSKRMPTYTLSDDGETIDVVLPAKKIHAKIILSLVTAIIVLYAAISLWPQSYIMVDVQNDSSDLSAHRIALCREIIPSTVVIVDRIYFDYKYTNGYVPLRFNIMVFEHPTTATDEFGDIQWAVTPRLAVPNSQDIDKLYQQQLIQEQYLAL